MIPALRSLQVFWLWFIVVAAVQLQGNRADEPAAAPISTAPSDPPSVDADILLTGGTLHIGDGSAGLQGDVAITDGRIVGVGQFAIGKVKRRIDCSGLIVSPGFIDLHNHSDAPILKSETRSAMNYLTQGCTTIVTGNCGSGPIHVADYYDKIDRLGAGVNVAHLLPQGDLRLEVVGSEDRPASDDELASMRRLANQAMLDGAWGMTSGLIYVPSSYASTKELIAISRVIAEHGGFYGSHIRGEGTGLLEAVQEALEIGRQAKLPVHISHFKASGKDAWGLVRAASGMIEQARQSGQSVTADQYPYTASSTSLAATFIPPAARAGKRELWVEQLRSDTNEARDARQSIQKKVDLSDAGYRIQIARCSARPEWSGKRLSEIAEVESISVLELILRIEELGGASVVNHGMNEMDVQYVMTLPWVATASDGSSKVPSEDVPHPRSYGTFSRRLGHYALREKVVSLEHSIHSATGLPAKILGLTDRGLLQVQSMADVVVWDPQMLMDQATYEEPFKPSVGMRYVLVNGVPAIDNGYATGALSGKALRKAPKAP